MTSRAQQREGLIEQSTSGRGESVPQITHLPDDVAPKRDLKPTLPVTVPLCSLREGTLCRLPDSAVMMVEKTVQPFTA